MNNNINISISIENLQATANGCSFDKASINVDSNYGNEIASVLQELLQTAMSKIQTPTPTTTTTPEPEVKKVVEKAVQSVVSSTGDFCEVHEAPTTAKEAPKCNFDLLATFMIFENILKPEGWVSDGLGNIKYQPEGMKRVLAEINLDDTSITIKDMMEPGNSVVTWIYKDRIRFGGIAPQFARNYYENSKISGMMDIYQVIKDFIKC